MPPPPRLEVAAKHEKAVELSIEDNPDGSGFVDDWLVAASDLDDCNASDVETHGRWHHLEPGAIGAAKRESISSRLSEWIPMIPHILRWGSLRALVAAEALGFFSSVFGGLLILPLYGVTGARARVVAR